MAYDQQQDVIDSDREKAAQWARDLLARSDWVILDTETTGLDHTAEVVQIAVLSPDGTVLLDTLVRPTRPIPPDATRIHGITDAMVADASPWADVHAHVQLLIGNCDVVVYNADYDRRVMRQCSYAAGLGGLTPRDWLCAMEMYAQWYGDWSDHHGSYRWQKLQGGDHSALGDCRATLAALGRMAGVPEKVEEKKPPAGKPILCLDFDGVIHSYTSGWKGAAVIPDPPVPGAIKFLHEAVYHFRIAIFSRRSNQPGGIEAMKVWLKAASEADPVHLGPWFLQLEWPTENPPAFLTIDDRAWTFNGTWPSIEELKGFKPWNK